MNKFKKLYKQLFSSTNKCADFAPLLARITVGYIFVEAGWGKFQHLDKVVEFFTELNIPAPALQAPFVAAVELFGGLFVLVGLLTRLASVPLIATMVVAIITAKSEEISGVSDLLGMSEYLYIVIFVWLICKGPGKHSIDNAVLKID